MNSENWQSLATSWVFSPWVVGWLLVFALVYLRGWLRIRARSGPVPHSRFGGIQLGCFLAGLFTVFIAIQSPLDALAAFSLQVHMIQHLLLIIIAPLLLLWGRPMLPIVSGLPQSFRRDWFTPFANYRPLRRFLARLFHPVTTWLVFVLILWGWHAPRAYELALQSPAWHRVEHACFLAASVLFWFPIVRPYPIRPKWTTWLLLPYLVLAGVQGTALSGILTFADSVLYRHYESMPSLLGVTPLVDQALAGAIMWVPMSIAYLIALVWMVGQQFASSPQRAASLRRQAGQEPVPVVERPAASQHVARVHVLNSVLRPLVVRRGLQLLILGLTIAVIVDGLWGPQVAPLNLAGVLPWIHWRGLLVIALVLGGNFFCAVCPFTFFSNLFGFNSRAPQHRATRDSGRGGWFGQWRWPVALRNKWTAIGLLVLFFWAYEYFALWDRPLATAGITLSFLVIAFVLNHAFVDAPFCKFLCPIGQFNFVQSLYSPTAIASVSSATCSGCKTRDCIVGNATNSGCQLELFQPKKIGNMDCTFCFDCADACPHGNVALVQIGRGSDLGHDPNRSGVGRFSERFDITVLIVLLFVAALVNAAWMTSPLLGVEDRMVELFGGSRMLVVALGMLVALLLLPAATLLGLSYTDLRWSGDRLGMPDWSTMKRYLARRAPALVPLGLAMWLAHYIFHLVTTWDSAGVAARRAMAQLSGRAFDVVPGACACCKANSIEWLVPMEFTFLALGLCGSFAVLFQITKRETGTSLALAKSVSLWTLMLAMYYVACLWVLLQPMQMRGAIG